MKLQQLRYAVETFRCNLNVSEAAERLFTSQPGVSKQIRLLEDELGVQIFIRSGKRIVAVTPAGKAVLETAEQILRDVHKIKHIGSEFASQDKGVLTVATTPTLAQFRLPEVASAFLRAHHEVELTFKQGSPDDITAMVLHGEADFAVSSQTPQQLGDLKRLLCECWAYALLMPATHRLAQVGEISLHDIASEPLLTYDYMLQHHAPLGRALARQDLDNYRVALASNDNELLKTYTGLGLGVAVVDKLAVSALDKTWAVRDIAHLFEPSHVQIIVRQDVLLRTYAYDFIELISADLTRGQVDKLLYAPPADDFSI